MTWTNLTTSLLFHGVPVSSEVYHGSLSKVLVKSRKIGHVLSCFSIAFNMFVYKSNAAYSVDFPFWNPKDFSVYNMKKIKLYGYRYINIYKHI